MLSKLLPSTHSPSTSDGITITTTESTSILLEENGWVWLVFQKPEITLEPHGDNVPWPFGIGIGTAEEPTISQPITILTIPTEMNNWTTTIFKNLIILGISSTMDIPRLNKEIMPSSDLAEPVEYQQLTSPMSIISSLLKCSDSQLVDQVPITVSTVDSPLSNSTMVKAHSLGMTISF
jgi:hypothetical protein